MSNSFKLCSTYFSREEENFSRGGFAPSWLRACAVDFVSAGKKTLILYVTVCEKVVPRLNNHDDVIE